MSLPPPLPQSQLKLNQARDYLDTSGLSGMRVSVPAYERTKHLYALGYTNVQITEVLRNEFQDIEINPISAISIKKIISNNAREFEIARMELGLKCRDEIQRVTAVLFSATEDVELTMVQVYVNKLKQALASMSDLDIDELDDNGNYANTSRMFILIEMCEKLQSKIAKIVGTDALREVEVFRQKAEAKRQAEESFNGMIPVQGKTIDASPETNFI